MLLAQLWPASAAMFLHAERWVNDGSPSGYSAGPHQVSPQYSPFAETSEYLLPTLRRSMHEVQWYGSEQDLAARFLSPAGTDVHLPVHPDTLRWLGLRSTGRNIQVAPTSSARTVTALEPAQPIHVKLHYPGLLGRAPRELTSRRVGISVAVSAELSRIAGTGQLDAGTSFLPEPTGCVLDTGKGEVGVLIRDAAATVPTEPGRTVVPWFALTSADRHNPGDPTLLAQLAISLGWSGADLLTNVIGPLLRSYFTLALRWGLVPEAHGQNVLIELDSRGRGRRVIFRDLLDVVCDPLARSVAGLPSVAGARNWDPANLSGLHAWRSWAYDFKLGEYALEPVLRAFADCTGADLAQLRRETAAAAHELATDLGWRLRDYFMPWEHVSYLDSRVPDWSQGPALLSRAGPAYR